MITKLLSDEQCALDRSERAYLQMITSHHTKTYTVDEFCLIGRDESCQICLDNPFVSQRHARVMRKDQLYYIQDLHSRNGVFINGTRIVEAQIKDKDRIQVANQELIFSIEQEEKSTQLKLTSKNEKWNAQLGNLPNMAQKDFPVLITGPSGTGKEILAQLLHRYSQRNYGPFISVNCSALSENLVESELFGHVKGSFTGAENNRKGAFESARNGTLFLDEIGDLPLNLQPKLLRAIENCEIKPVGSDKSLHTNVRIIAATHNTLQQKVSASKFRQDLYYRLNVLKLSPPAMRDRMEDFENLIYFFAKQFRVAFTFAAIQELKKHDWPGNVRELKNFVARASAHYPRQTIEVEHLNGLMDKTHPAVNLVEDFIKERVSLKDVEREMICRALINHRGNQRKAAAQLGIPKSTFHDRLKTFNINIESLLG